MSLCFCKTSLNKSQSSSKRCANAPPNMLGLIAIASHCSIAYEFVNPKSTVKLSPTIETVCSLSNMFIDKRGKFKPDKSTLMFKSVA